MSKKVLYIEDDLHNMTIVKKTIESRGYNFLWGGTGIQGLNLARQNSPDLILVDLTLPDIDGIDVVKRLRSGETSTLKYIPIIALTGRTSQGDVKKALDVGCDVYMVKPVDLRELSARVEGFLGV